MDAKEAGALREELASLRAERQKALILLREMTAQVDSLRESRAALRSAIRLCGPGVPVRAIGAHIGALAEAEGFEVVTAFAGHGIGEVFHTQPLVHHGPNSSAYVLREGMAFTIEPMLVEGSADVGLWDDGWAVVTTDGGRAAQFEHTMLVTAHGVDVLTLYEDEP